MFMSKVLILLDFYMLVSERTRSRVVHVCGEEGDDGWKKAPEEARWGWALAFQLICSQLTIRDYF